MKKPPFFVEQRYKANSYLLAIGLLAAIGLLMVLAEHMLKSPEPITSLFRKSEKDYVQENIALRAANDSLRVIAAKVDVLEAQGTGSTVRNVAVPRLGHFDDPEGLKESNFQAYTLAKLRFYFQKSDSLERFINLHM